MRGRPPRFSADTILDAARDAFRREGHAATTADIARRAGISEGTLFYRYRSKEALLAAVIRREAEPPERLRELLRQAGRGSLAAKLEGLVESVLDSATRVHPLFELAQSSPASTIIREALLSPPEKAGPQRMIELLGRYFQAEIRLGRVRKTDGNSVGRVIFGACVEYVRTCEFTGFHEDRSRFIRGLVDLILHGIAATTHPDE
jgi:AcrR family transcriptional regulator